VSRKPKRRFGGIFFLLLLIVAGAAFLAWQHYSSFANRPMPGIATGSSVVVERGDSLPVVLRKLRAAGVETGEPFEWRALAHRLRAAGKLQVGEYPLDPKTSPRELLIAMRDGKVIQRRFTIVEGWNIRELRAALGRAKPLTQNTAQLDDTALMKALGHPGQHPEGRFLPETYLYTAGDSDLDVLRPRREHQQQFGFDRRRLVVRVEKKAADLLGERRAAGLARGNHFEPALKQEPAQRREHGRFAGAFATFDGDEAWVRLQRHCFSAEGAVTRPCCAR
jgi:hypothetical protein